MPAPNHLTPDELEARLLLHHLPEIGPRRFRQLLGAFGSAAEALQASAAAWQSLGLPSSTHAARHCPRVLRRVHSARAWLDAADHSLIPHDAPTYPALLAELHDAPPLLFVAGNAAILERPQLALVGSRRASRAGVGEASSFARHLAAGGFVITSGLALGIDAAAHQGALDAGGLTIAVLGTGLKEIYPPRHRDLAQRIRDNGGALLSELPLDTAAQACNFPRRNRLISGLSLGVLVVEAGLSSGSLITARLAAEQGREVFAIPGPIHHPGSRGCHQLIREGAQLVESVADIFDNLRGWQNCAPAPTRRKVRSAPPVEPVKRSPQQGRLLLPTPSAEGAALLALLKQGPLDSETLAQCSGQPIAALLALLTELELDGHLSAENGVWHYCGP